MTLVVGPGRPLSHGCDFMQRGNLSSKGLGKSKFQEVTTAHPLTSTGISARAAFSGTMYLFLGSLPAAERVTSGGGLFPRQSFLHPQPAAAGSQTGRQLRADTGFTSYSAKSAATLLGFCVAVVTYIPAMRSPQLPVSLDQTLFRIHLDHLAYPVKRMGTDRHRALIRLALEELDELPVRHSHQLQPPRQCDPIPIHPHIALGGTSELSFRLQSSLDSLLVGRALCPFSHGDSYRAGTSLPW